MTDIKNNASVSSQNTKAIEEIAPRKIFEQQGIERARRTWNKSVDREHRLTVEQFKSIALGKAELPEGSPTEIEHPSGPGRWNGKKKDMSALIKDEMKFAKIREDQRLDALDGVKEAKDAKKELLAKLNKSGSDPEVGGSTTILQYPSNLNKEEYPDDFGDATNKGYGHYILFYINAAPGPAANAGMMAQNKITGKQERLDNINRDISAKVPDNTLKSFTVDAVANTKLSNARSKFGTRPERTSGQPAILQNSGGAGRPLYKDFLAASQRLNTAIALYMPNQVQSSYTLNYADVETGFVATALGEIFKGLEGGQSQLEGPQLTRGAMGAAYKGLDMVAPGATNIMSVQAGRILNNKMELAFKGVGRRKFQFTFTFTPKSADEATEIDTIIARFKMHSHPEFIPGSAGMMMTIPDTFDIQYMYNDKENSFLNRISTCFCTGISVQYGGDRFTAHLPTANHQGAQGSPPTKTVLSMEFQELETITRERIVEGY